MSVEALKAGKHVACTVPMGTSDRRMPADRRGPARERQGLHDDGDGRLQPRIPVRQGAVRQGRAGPAPVPARQPPAGHGRLARLLAGPAADVVRHPLRQPLPGDPGQARRERRLPRVGPDPRGADRPSTAARSPSRRPRSPSRIPTSSPRSPAACSTRPGSTARASTPTAARRASSGSRSRARSRSSTPRARRNTRSPSPRSPSGSRCPTMPISCPSRSAGSHQAVRRFRTPSTSRSSRAEATAARIRTWSTPS